MLQKRIGGTEYGLKERECHGLKELIGLLTFLYDDDNNCLIIDEPKLHLHPQFQTFFLQEIRKIAGNPLNNPDIISPQLVQATPPLLYHTFVSSG